MCEELSGTLFPGVVDELFGRAFFHDHAAIHEQDAVGHIACKVHLMGDNDHRGLAVSKITQDLQHLTGQLRVKGAGGLIKAKDIRVKRQRAGNGHTLVGSSVINNSGRVNSAIAIITRWRSPPES